MNGFFATKTQQESGGLLSDWQAYQRDGDVEAQTGGSAQSQASTSAAGAGPSALEVAGGSIWKLFGAPAVASTTTSGQTIASQNGFLGFVGRAREAASAYAPPTGEQITLFLGLLSGGLLFLAIAFFVCLPVIVLSPRKFALAYTLGCALVLSAFAALRGFRRQMQHMVSSDRLPFTAVYALSMAGTLYFAIVQQSYLLSLAFCIAQMLALLYYLASSFPGGTQGVQWVLGVAGHACLSCVKGVVTGQGK